MTTGYAERYDEMLTQAYGPFWPGSAARDLRTENARRGYRTCWYCIEAFRPQRVTAADGSVRRPGRGRLYCSTRCARAARRREAGGPVFEFVDADTIVFDLRGCRGCAA